MSERGSLADWLSAYMADQKWSSGFVADRGKLDATTVQRLSNGTTKDPSLDTLKSLAKGLRLPLEAVLEGIGAIPPRGGPNMPPSLRLLIQTLAEVPDAELERAMPAVLAVLEYRVGATRPTPSGPTVPVHPKT